MHSCCEEEKYIFFGDDDDETRIPLSFQLELFRLHNGMEWYKAFFIIYFF